MASEKIQVTFLQTDDRKEGIKTLFKALKAKSIRGKMFSSSRTSTPPTPRRGPLTTTPWLLW